jgi:hypothetical protein
MTLLGLPSLALNGGLVAYVIIALAMLAITIFVLGQILPRRGEAPLLTQLTLALAILAGGSVLVLALLFVFLDPDGTAAWTWVLLAFNFMMMGPAGIWFIGLIAFRDRRVRPGGWLWPAVLALVVAGSEVLMGVLFALGDTSASAVTWGILAVGLSSVWFFWSMAVVMAALLAWAPIGRAERWVLVALTSSAVVAPWVTAYPTVGGAAMAAIMAGVFFAILREVSQRGRVAADEVPALLGLGAAFLLMAITGASVAATGASTPSVLAFGGGMGLVMAVEIAYLCRRFYHGTFRTPWVLRAPDVDLASATASPRQDEAPGARTPPPLGAPAPPAVPSPPTGP